MIKTAATIARRTPAVLPTTTPAVSDGFSEGGASAASVSVGLPVGGSAVLWSFMVSLIPSVPDIVCDGSLKFCVFVLVTKLLGIIEVEGTADLLMDERRKLDILLICELRVVLVLELLSILVGKIDSVKV